MYYLSTEATLTLAVFSTCSVIAVATCVYVRQQHHKRTKARENRQRIMETLQAAMAKNCFFDLSIPGKGMAAKDCRCECIAVSLKNLILQLGEENPATLWANKEVHCFFRLVTHKTARIYDFVSTIQRVEKTGPFFQVTLPLPTLLGNQQRRAFVRFEPSEATLPNFTVWFGKTAIPPPSTVSEETLGLAEAANTVAQILHWHPLPASQVRVKDVSAGGIQLLLAASDPLWGSPKKGHIFLIQTTLTETRYKSPVTIVVIGIATRILPASQAGMCGVGIKFQRWAQVLVNKKPAWIPLTNHEGIPSLTAWIMHRQREQVRTGVA